MIVIPPIDCTAAGVLTASNAVDAAAWAAGTTYAAGVITSRAGRNWLSLQATNLGKTPGAEPLWWQDDGPINSLAMFDTSVSTATVRTGHLIFTLAPGRYTAIGFMGLIGNSIKIEIIDGATPIYSETRSLAASDGTFFSFCLEDMEQQQETTFHGLPGVPSSHITVTIYGASPTTGATACGLCVIGKQFEIGQAEYGFSVPIEDRGRHYLDALGNPVNLERGYSKGVSGAVVTDRVNFNRLNRFFADHVGLPCLWIAAPDQNDLVSATVFGRYVRAVPVIANFSQITAALEIAGYR
jgi:hypothetical protein